MSDPAKKEACWVAVAPNGHIRPRAARWYRKEAIKAITDVWAGRQAWKQLYRKGWRVKKAWIILKDEEEKP